MSIEFKDRVSTYPNRYLVTLENGTNYYATLERADEPTNPGTPLNASTLNQLVALDDLSKLPGKHLWKKHPGNPAATTTTEVTDVQIAMVASGASTAANTRYVSSSYFVNKDGYLVLDSPKSVLLSSLNSSEIQGKYYANRKSGNAVIYLIESDATIQVNRAGPNGNILYIASSAKEITSNPLLSFAMADTQDAYPDGKVHTDGYWYVYTKRFGDCNGAVDATAISMAVNAYLDEHPVTGGVTMDQVNAAIDAKIAAAIGGSY